VRPIWRDPECVTTTKGKGGGMWGEKKSVTRRKQRKASFLVVKVIRPESKKRGIFGAEQVAKKEHAWESTLQRTHGKSQVGTPKNRKGGVLRAEATGCHVGKWLQGDGCQKTGKKREDRQNVALPDGGQRGSRVRKQT